MKGKAIGPDRSGQAQESEYGDALHGIWSGTINFSLVAIPVQLVRAVEPGRISFRTLHKTDYSPLRRRMSCPKEERLVAPEEIIRGYETGPDKYIVITDEELESVTPDRSRTIEMVEFIDIKEVDPIYYDHPYYLVPTKGGEKAYSLLAKAMQRTDRAGLARFVLGEREHLVAIRSTGKALELITLHYSEEILGDEELLPAETEVSAGEKDRLIKGIRKMMADFDPAKYADSRRKKISAILKQKAKQRSIVEAPAMEEEEEEAAADLIAALKESISRVKKRQ